MSGSVRPIEPDSQPNLRNRTNLQQLQELASDEAHLVQLCGSARALKGLPIRDTAQACGANNTVAVRYFRLAQRSRMRGASEDGDGV